jgi:hypothetical protein
MVRIVIEGEPEKTEVKLVHSREERVWSEDTRLTYEFGVHNRQRSVRGE